MSANTQIFQSLKAVNGPRKKQIAIAFDLDAMQTGSVG
jgi:hypothetical protein